MFSYERMLGTEEEESRSSILGDLEFVIWGGEVEAGDVEEEMGRTFSWLCFSKIVLWLQFH